MAVLPILKVGLQNAAQAACTGPRSCRRPGLPFEVSPSLSLLLAPHPRRSQVLKFVVNSHRLAEIQLTGPVEVGEPPASLSLCPAQPHSCTEPLYPSRLMQFWPYLVLPAAVLKGTVNTTAETFLLDNATTNCFLPSFPIEEMSALSQFPSNKPDKFPFVYGSTQMARPLFKLCDHRSVVALWKGVAAVGEDRALLGDIFAGSMKYFVALVVLLAGLVVAAIGAKLQPLPLPNNSAHPPSRLLVVFACICTPEE